MSQTHTTSLFK